MKKLLSVIMIILMLPTFGASAFAAADDGGLAAALAAAKSKFSIPAEYTTFTYNSSESNEKKSWQFNWSDGKSRSINISVDSAGRLQRYANYSGTPIATKISAPQITRAQAKTIAENTLKKVAPDVANHLKEGRGAGANTYSSVYTFEFDRYENGIPLAANVVWADVNYITKELTALTITWEYDAVIPSPKGVIDMSTALKNWKNGQTATLSYRLVDDKGDGSAVKAVLVYSTDKNYLTVDAFTGETFAQSYNWQQSPSTASMKSFDANVSEASSGISFTPVELEKITDSQKLITVQKADQILRNISSLDFDSSYKLTSKSLSTDYNDKSKYRWDLTYGGPITQGDFNPQYAHASVDAKTGELLSFYASKKEESVGKDIGQDAAKINAQAFLKATIPTRFSNVVASEDSRVSYPYNERGNDSVPASYSFIYVRVHSNIKLNTDTINTQVNAENGKISSFSFYWHDNVTFEPVAGILSGTQAIEKLVSQCGFLLQYEFFTTYYYDKPASGSDISKDTKIVSPVDTVQNSKTVRLIYSPDYALPQSVFARSGVLAGNDGNPYEKTSDLISYSDLKNSSVKEQAGLLADVGIGFGGGKLISEKIVTQKEILSLLKKTFVTSQIYYSSMQEQGEADLYEEMLTKGIIIKSEVKPDAIVTKLDALRFIIRAAGLTKAAELQGIYKTPYKDSALIAEKDMGYCALAYGLGLAGEAGDMLEPSKPLNRAQTVFMLYKYLKV